MSNKLKIWVAVALVGVPFHLYWIFVLVSWLFFGINYDLDVIYRFCAAFLISFANIGALSILSVDINGTELK